MSRKNDPRRSSVWAEVHLDRLRQNLKVIRSRLDSPRVEVLAIVKADAYGHGMPAVARALERAGIAFFGVANLEEALLLRKICPTAAILVLGSFREDQLGLYRRKKILPTVSSVEDLGWIRRALRGTRGAFPVHVKVDTGMGRLGVWHQEAEDLFRWIRKDRQVTVEGVYTHFSSADEKGSAFTNRQIRAFSEVMKKVKALGFRPRYWHAANSLGLVRFKKAHLNLVRPGILLYGLNPSARHPLPRGLRPVLELKTRISFLKKTAPGRTISYGATHHTLGPTAIATLPVGYSHGYRVAFSNKSHVIVRGQRCPVVGRVTMDQTLVDVGRAAGARRWTDEVILIGRQGKNEVSAEELAVLGGTIPYEIVCSIHSRIPRLYKGLKGL